MKIKDLASFKRIVIQGHDVPDADSIASGYAMQRYLRSLGADAVHVYGGRAAVTKPNLLIMLDALRIELTFTNEIPPDTDLLIMVDCQRGGGNTTKYDLPESAEVFVIDHHRPEMPEGENTVIRPNMASCSTVVWDLLAKEGFAFDVKLQTALYYGLFTDTNGLSELRHPLDRDLADIPHDAGLIKKMKNSTITLDEIDIMGAALRNYEVMGNIGIFRAEPCDPNLLGFISDIAQQVVHMDCCVVYCAIQHGLKLSVRTSAREIMANEIAEFICRDAGNGGGALDKAGGFMSYKAIEEAAGAVEEKEYLESRVHAYMNNYELVYAGSNDYDFGAMPLYKKLDRPVGFAKSTDIFPAGTKITIRTLEGDVDTLSSETTNLMIGIMGEVYPISLETFERSYRDSGQAYAGATDYPPVIINRIDGARKEILPFAKTCLPKEKKYVRAAHISKDTKVFTNWDTEKYFKGSAGDYIVANEGFPGDCYIVRRDIFEDSYERL